MKRSKYVILMSMLALNLNAGSLTDGKWSATSCGSRPDQPEIASKEAESYNQSLKEIKIWQDKTQAYNNCVVKEANQDNDAIAKEANEEQERFRRAVAEISAHAAAIKTKLDKK